MKLTKDQRHTAYIIMLSETKIDDYDGICQDGFCHMVWNLFQLEDCFPSFHTVLDMLPELQAKKPENILYNGLWFDADKSGWMKRREFLKQCIKETYNF